MSIKKIKNYRKTKDKYQLIILLAQKRVIMAETDRKIPRGSLDPIFLSPKEIKINATKQPII